MFEDGETEVMLNAQKEGLSPRFAKAFYKLELADNPIMRIGVALEAFGYDNKKIGVPDLCPGTACLRKETTDGCEQYWNEKGDGAFLFVYKMCVPYETGPLLKTKDGRIAIANMKIRRKDMGLLYTGDEKNLKDIKLGHLPLKCPNTEKACGNSTKIYSVEDPADCLIGIVSDRDYKLYMGIVKRELAAVELKKNAYCESVHGKPGC